MENRFLCRGTRIGNGEWVEGFLVPFAGDEKNRFWQIKKVDDIKKPSISQTVRVNPSTICQCTGLKDKNGKLIWENDILLQKTTEKHWCEWQHMGLVKYGEHDWNEGVYGYKNIGFFVEPIVKEGDETRMKPGLCQEDLVFENYPYEVIGNTFDNPELLEV